MVDTAGTMLARDWRLEVDTGTSTPTWTPVLGLKSCNYITEGAEQDDSTIDGEGYGSQIVTGIAARIEASGFRIGGDVAGTFTEDPGQVFLRQKGQKTGVENIVSARIYRTDESDEAHQLTATVKWATQSASDVNALQEFQVTLSSRGKPQDIEKPATPSGPAISTAQGLMDGTVGTSYTDTVTATGGTAPLSFAVTTGSLPDGLSMASSGTITGTPTTAGAETFTVTVTDSASATDAAEFTITVNE